MRPFSVHATTLPCVPSGASTAASDACMHAMARYASIGIHMAQTWPTEEIRIYHTFGMVAVQHKPQDAGDGEHGHAKGSHDINDHTPVWEGIGVNAVTQVERGKGKSSKQVGIQKLTQHR